MSQFWVSYELKDGRRIGRAFTGKADAEAFYAEQERAKVRRLRLEQGSTLLRGDNGQRLVNRDGRPVTTQAALGSLWEGE